jgi:hypothetical protein
MLLLIILYKILANNSWFIWHEMQFGALEFAVILIRTIDAFQVLEDKVILMFVIYGKEMLLFNLAFPNSCQKCLLR